MFDHESRSSLSSKEEGEKVLPKNNNLNKAKNFYGTNFTPISKTFTTFGVRKEKKRLYNSQLNHDMSNKKNGPSSALFLYYPNSNKYQNTFEDNYYPESKSNTWIPANQFNNHVHNHTQLKSVGHDMTTKKYFPQHDTTTQR